MEKHIRDPVTVQLYAMANGRKSEYHNFVYTPKEDRYSAIPSYSLQSHVAEGNCCLLHGAERVPSRELKICDRRSILRDSWSDP